MYHTPPTGVSASAIAAESRLSAPDEPTPCLNWATIPRSPEGWDYEGVPLCRRAFCPCPVSPGSDLTHGRHERLQQARHLSRKAPAGTAFLSGLIHVRAALAPAELSKLFAHARKAVRRLDPAATLWAVAHWRNVPVSDGRWAKVPHLHLALFTLLPSLFLSCPSKGMETYTESVRERGAALREAPRRGRPRADKSLIVTKTTTGTDRVRVEPFPFREGGEVGAFLYYALRCQARQESVVVSPPSGSRWLYGTPAKWKAVARPKRKRVPLVVDEHGEILPVG